MIALSSYAPMSRAPEIARNQLVAKSTWDKTFSAIVYFNPVEERFVNANTGFTGQTERPSIRQMAEYAAEQNGWVAIINADVVVAMKMVGIDSVLNSQKVWCGMSRRLEFDPTGPPRKGRLVDLGLDFFFARPSVWALVASEIPDDFTIGRQQWDTWVLSFFIIHGGEYCVDLTPSNLIWHPKHDNRLDFHLKRPPGDTYLDRVSWPKRMISV